jgi:hypothetical protein
VQFPTYQPALNDLSAQGSAQEALLERAAGLTRQVFGRQVFVRAVVEVSSFCRENCHYCGMRRDNRGLTRFRSTPEQLLEWITPSQERERCLLYKRDRVIMTEERVLNAIHQAGLTPAKESLWGCPAEPQAVLPARRTSPSMTRSQAAVGLVPAR